MKSQSLLSLLVAFPTIALAADAVSGDCQCLPGAELPRITDGNFALRVEDSVDLTDSNVLLTFSTVGKDWKGTYYEFRINGKVEGATIGRRFDLKEYSSRLSGRDECWLDFYKVIDAKGTPVTASFRLDCP